MHAEPPDQWPASVSGAAERHRSEELSFNDSDVSASVLSSLDDLDPLDADMADEVAHDVTIGDGQEASLGVVPKEEVHPQPQRDNKAAGSVLPHLAALAAAPVLAAGPESASGASSELAESDLSISDVEDVLELAPDLDVPVVAVPAHEHSMPAAAQPPPSGRDRTWTDSASKPEPVSEILDLPQQQRPSEAPASPHAPSIQPPERKGQHPLPAITSQQQQEDELMQHSASEAGSSSRDTAQLQEENEGPDAAPVESAHTPQAAPEADTTPRGISPFAAHASRTDDGAASLGASPTAAVAAESQHWQKAACENISAPEGIAPMGAQGARTGASATAPTAASAAAPAAAAAGALAGSDVSEAGSLWATQVGQW